MLIWCLMDGKRGKLYQTPECFDRSDQYITTNYGSEINTFDAVAI